MASSAVGVAAADPNASASASASSSASAVPDHKTESDEPDKELPAPAIIPADAKLTKAQLRKQDIYTFEGQDYTAFQHEDDLEVLRQWHKCTRTSSGS